MTILDGPSVAPFSNGPAKQLVVLCHGYGSNGDDLIGLAPHWQRALPDAAFIAPHAPDPVPLAPGGYQWFPISNADRAAVDRGVVASASVLDTFLNEALVKYDVEPENLALVGFSQGTMMILHVGLRRKVAPACILGYSGVLAVPERLAEDVKIKPPVMLIHGNQDPMIPEEALHSAVRYLGDSGIDVRWHVSQGIPHSIGADGLALGGQFLVRHLTN